MSQKRLSMRKVKEVLRLRFELGLDHRQIARSCRISHVTVGKYLSRFAATGLNWPLPADMDDGELVRRLHANAKGGALPVRPLPDPAMLHRELRRKGMTLQGLWQEYREDHPEVSRGTQNSPSVGNENSPTPWS